MDNNSTSAPTIIVIVLIICVAVYLVVYRIYPGPDNKEILEKSIPLNKKKNVLMPDRVQTEILGSGGSTVMSFFYLNQGDKTLRYSKVDEYIPLIQVENNWSLEIVPSPKDKKDYGAQLRIRTQQAGQFKEEIISLPSIPKQKWIFISILREGRRFDVMYDNRIVASQRLEHYPVVIASPLSVGNVGLDGKAVHMKINSKRLSPDEVDRERVNHVDPSGMVVDMKWGDRPPLKFMDFQLPELSLSWMTTRCLPGLPCDNVTVPPNKSIYEWKTPYA